MSELHPQQRHLLNCISLEMGEQEQRYKTGPELGLKKLRADGVLLHPIQVTRKTFGYADYPEISFRLPFSTDTGNFRDSSSIECFIEGEDSVKGILFGMDGSQGTFRLFAPDFPDWIEDKGVGIKLAPDHYTSELMKSAIEGLSEHPAAFQLFQHIHGEAAFGANEPTPIELSFRNEGLNAHQKNAVLGMVQNTDLLLIHGPPGTGKTTTLLEGIAQLIQEGKRILVTAPSNAAVDNIAKGLVENGCKILRVGNSLKVDEVIFPFTSEGKMLHAKEHKEIKRLKIQAEEYRRMAMQYKRRFGKDEREQRSLLMREVKSIRKQIRDLRDYFDEKLVEQADVVLGTPVGLKNFLGDDAQYDVLVMDEAGQALEPLAWLVIPYAHTWILAGDPFQLPPTVLSSAAEQAGFAVSILEQAFKQCKNRFFLATQYRMRASIAGFSSAYFYEGALLTPPKQADVAVHITFFDTAGTGFEEQHGKDGFSLLNEGELDLVRKILIEEKIDTTAAAFISPYAGQIQLAKDALPNELRVSTIDSFQGQERATIVLSLVRSNPDSTIGFLKDYRRMNVALTRAKERLFVIGDSSTIGQDPFYAAFLVYMEAIGGYRSAWELMN